MGRRAGVSAIATICLLLGSGVVSGSALGRESLGQPISLLPDPLKIGFEAWTSPEKISRTTPTPVKLNLEGSISTTDGSRAPTLETLSLSFDRGGAIFTKGLPTCSIWELVGEIEHPKPPCETALVGRGVVHMQIYVPGRGSEEASGQMEIFNGRLQAGRPGFIYRVYAHVPAATSFVASGPILEQRGRFGTQTTIRIPKIVSGDGLLTAFKARIGRTWTYEGKKVSLFTATCPKGSLSAVAEFDFVGGEKLRGEFERPCV